MIDDVDELDDSMLINQTTRYFVSNQHTFSNHVKWHVKMSIS